MKLKKLISLATGIMLLSSIAIMGCSSNSSNGSPSAKDVGKTVKLTWYTVGQEPKDLKVVEDEVNKYLTEKINATIDMKFIDYGDYNQKMSVMINSGESFDLAFTCSWAGDYLGNARKGAFLELNDYLDKQGKDMKAAIDKRFWQGATIDGKIYAVPNQKELSTSPTWVFTKEYVDKYNIPYKDIHSLQDLEPWLKLIKEKEPNVTPLYITKGFSAPQYFDQLVDPVGIEYGDESLTVKNMFETEYMKTQLKTLRKYYQEGYINSDSATAKDDKALKRFVTKGDGQPYAENIWSKDLGYPVVSSSIMDTFITNGSATGSMIGISKNSEHPDKAVEFLNLLNTDEKLRNLINYGIEGTHYTKASDDRIKLLDKQKDYQVAYFATGNLFITYPMDTEPKTKWDEFKAFNDKAKNSPALGFKFNTSKVTTQIAAINNVLEEYKAAIYSGSVDPDEYLDKLNRKLKEQGIDDVIKEMQTQINEWVKTNKK